MCRVGDAGASGREAGAWAGCKSRATPSWRGLEMAAMVCEGPGDFLGCARAPLGCLMMGSGEDTTDKIRP